MVAHLDHLERVLDLGLQLCLGVFNLALGLKQHTAFAVLLGRTANDQITSRPACSGRLAAPVQLASPRTYDS